MIDRPARDWLANLTYQFLAGRFRPEEPPTKFTVAPAEVEPLPPNAHAKSKDPIIEDGYEELATACGALTQMNAYGTVPLITNAQDDHRRLRNLLLFLRSDLDCVSSNSELNYLFWPIILALAFGIALFIEYGKGPAEILKTTVFAVFGLCFGCIMLPLYLLSLLGFVWHRWIKPPKHHTDEQDFWPFPSYQALLDERARQKSQTPSQTISNSLN